VTHRQHVEINIYSWTKLHVSRCVHGELSLTGQRGSAKWESMRLVDHFNNSNITGVEIM
jgi:hypothetical protein